MLSELSALASKEPSSSDPSSSSLSTPPLEPPSRLPGLELSSLLERDVCGVGTSSSVVEDALDADSRDCSVERSTATVVLTKLSNEMVFSLSSWLPSLLFEFHARVAVVALCAASVVTTPPSCSSTAADPEPELTSCS